MKRVLCCIVAAAGALLLSATDGFSFSSYGTSVNNACAPETVFTGDCTLCHASSKSTFTPAMDAFLTGGSTLTDFFCPAGPVCTDNDGDSFALEGGDCGPVDCNDANASIHPGATEIPYDGIDQDCFGGDLVDMDGDGVAYPADCNDGNSAVFAAVSGYADNDGDTYTVGGAQQFCTAGSLPAGFLAARNGEDCNDGDGAINPGAAEIAYDGIDQNCSGGDLVDVDGDGVAWPADCDDNNGAAFATLSGFADGDGDGFTNGGAQQFCTAGSLPTGFASVANGEDCNDADASINPAAAEIAYDGIDQNCSGGDLTDVDGDSWSSPADCDDNNAAINPGAAEICGDNADNNCDGQVDEGCVVEPVCTDADGDTYALEGGDCGPVDCNDTDAAVNPAAAENCTDSFDNNCNGLIDGQDPGAIGCPPACTDNDGDFYAIEGGVCGPVDCDDNDPGVNPGGVEICGDNADNNCDGQVDEGCVVEPTCTDNDGDTYAVEGGACGAMDCNDNDGAVSPDALEICGDNTDNNCDGQVDEGCVVEPACTDNDEDTYAIEGGDCGPVDCDDTDADVYPGAVENCTDGIDNNCNGFVDATDATALDCPVLCTDNDGDGYAVEGGECGPVDCHDNDFEINPGYLEICDDGIDNDCDGQTDEGCNPACPDVDGDGYLDALCGGTDCDDTDAAINPGAAEVCGNNVDENCNGASDDECLSCPDGGVLRITEAEYNTRSRTLTVEGRSHNRTRLSVVDPATGEVLADNLRVNGGKWKAKIRGLRDGNVPLTVEVVNADGCFAEQAVSQRSSKGWRDRDGDYRRDRDDDDDRDRHDDDDD